METQQSQRKTLLWIIVISLVGVLTWLGVLLLLWRALEANGQQVDLWAMIGALSTAVATAAVFTAGYVAYRELSEISNSRVIDITQRLFDEMNSAENIAARRWVYQNLPDDPQQGLSILTPEGQEAIKQVLNSLDRVAFLTQPGWIDDELIMPWMNLMVVKAWARLGPYVIYERQRRGEPDYYLIAQKLAERCLAWRDAHLPDAKIIWVQDAL